MSENTSMRRAGRRYARWFDRLPAQAAAKVTVALVRMRQGNLSNVKGVGEGVLEYRIDWGPGYRIYLGRDGETVIILLGGGSKKGQTSMPLTRDFKDTVQARAQRDAAFRVALLQEAVDCMLAGDVDTGKIVLRDYINATVGFDELGTVTRKSPKSLMRMLSPDGNPQARNLFEIVAYLQKNEGLRLTTRTARHRVRT